MSVFALGGAGNMVVPDYSSLLGLGGSVTSPLEVDVLNQGSLAPTTGITAQVPNFGTASNGVLGTGMNGFQLGNAAISGLQTLGSLWMASKQMKLAKKQFKFTKDITNINLNNQMQSYNTALADRARSRGVMEGQTPGQVQQYISANSLSRDQGQNNGYSVGNVSSAALNNYSSYLGRGTSGYTGGSSSSTPAASATPTAAARDQDNDRG